MKLTSGVYENLISEQLEVEKKAAEQERLACIEQPVDSAEHPRMIADYISNLIQQKLSDESLNAEERVEIANRIIRQIGDIPQEETLKETDQILAAVVPEEEKVRLEQTSDTVEHPKRHLPAGEYQITSFPFRHGDGALSLKHGEIIVGKHLLPGVVTDSQATYDRLYERLKKAFQRGTPVRIKIVG